MLMRLPRHNLRADALTARQNARQHGREGRQRRPVNFVEVDRAGLARPFLSCGRTFRTGVSAADLLILPEFSISRRRRVSRGRFIESLMD